MSAPVQGALDGFTPEILPAPKSRPGEGKRRGKGKFRSTLDKAMRLRWHEALAQLMEGVMARDPTCTRIYWERVMPAPKRLAIELSTADNKPLRIETPADAREAMAHVLSMVAAGELASDEADELITCYGKYLAASSIHTLSDAGEKAGGGEDLRKMLADRFGRILAAKAAAPEPEDEPAAVPIGFHIASSEDRSPAPADSIAAMTEDELTERVLEAVARKLEDS